MHPRRPRLRLRRRTALIWLAAATAIAIAGAVAVQTGASASPSRPAQRAAAASAARPDAGRALAGRPVGVLTPLQSCAQLAALDLTGLPGAPTQIGSATTIPRH